MLMVHLPTMVVPKELQTHCMATLRRLRQQRHFMENLMQKEPF